MNKIKLNIPKSIKKNELDSKIKTIKNYIGGEFINSESNEFIVNINPATNEILSYIPKSTKNDVEDAFIAANSSFKLGKWKNLSNNNRADVLEKIANGILKRFDEFAKTESQGI